MSIYKILDLDIHTSTSEKSELEKSLKALTGVESIQLDPERGEIALTYAQKSVLSDDQVQDAVRKAGFTPGDRC